jgi:VanZ family protein
MKRGFLFLWGPPIGLMAAIFVASSLPTVPRLPNDPNNYAPHFGAFLVLSALFVRAFAGATWTGVTSIVLLKSWTAAAAYGATDELHQRFVPGRYPAFDDWIADATGALVAVILIMAFKAMTCRQTRPVPPA